MSGGERWCAERRGEAERWGEADRPCIFWIAIGLAWLIGGERPEGGSAFPGNPDGGLSIQHRMLAKSPGQHSLPRCSSLAHPPYQILNKPSGERAPISAQFAIGCIGVAMHVLGARIADHQQIDPG